MNRCVGAVARACPGNIYPRSYSRRSRECARWQSLNGAIREENMELGRIQELVMVSRVDFGIYLSDSDNSTEKVLLPAKQVPEGVRMGDKIEVFLYRDSKDRLIATTNKPLVTLGEVARLKVLEVSRIGAFLDWGLEKDLLLPFKEMTSGVETGDEVLVALYTDKSSRLCATMKVYPYLVKGYECNRGDWVEGTVYEISENFGAFVAIDDKYSALIPKREMTSKLKVNGKYRLRVTNIKEDGKIDLSLHEPSYIQMSIDADRVMKTIEANGYLDFTDKASPELIRDRMDMSKNEFKRAVGNLLKMGRIQILDDRIVPKKD